MIFHRISTYKMKIKHLQIKRIAIPFKQSFEHASASRSETESVLVTLESENGHLGYGEGCPRDYVTGESVDSAIVFFEKHKNSFKNIFDLADLKSWVTEFQTDIDLNPAAWCAIELAILDLMGKESQQSIEALLSLPQLEEDFYYTAVLGINSLKGFQQQLERYLNWGFQDFKIKISGNLKEDHEKIGLFQAMQNPSIKIRLDANNLWKNSRESVDYISELDYPFSGIEEPLQPKDFQGLRKIYDALKIPVILDESFFRKDHFQHIRESPEVWVINLRLSKMGGILRSLSIAEQAEKEGFSIIIGAQVGETSILTRAALTIANSIRDTLIAQEGAFGTHLLQYDITNQPLMFSKKGVLSHDAFAEKPGLGLSIDETLVGKS